MVKLTHKERMKIAMQHEEPDRIPYHVMFVPEVIRMLEERYKEKNKVRNFFQATYCGVSPLDILLGNDMLLLAYGISTGYYRESKTNSYVDEWGIKWKKIPYTTRNGVGYYTEIVEFPLADDNKIDTYVTPNVENENIGYAEKVIKKFGDEYYIVGVINCSTFEGFKYLRGMTQSFVDLVANKDIAQKIMSMLANYHVKLGLKLIDRGVDMLWLADDLGGEHSLSMSPETFREMVKPQIGYMINKFKKRNKDVKIAFHSDGYIEPIIDDLIEVGVDMLHPIQPESMDPTYIKKKYGKKVSMWGTISTQKTLPFGSPRDVGNEVRERIRTCGLGGGFLIAPTHNIQLDVPIENIEAFYYSVEKYGHYPLEF